MEEYDIQIAEDIQEAYDEILNLNLWEGDYLFLNKMYKDDSYFEMELVYVSDKLISYKVKEWYYDISKVNSTSSKPSNRTW